MDDFVWSTWIPQEGVFDQFNNSCDHSFVAPNVHQFGDFDHVGGGECEDSKVLSASKNHSEAEKRRRDRINAHLDTLRKLTSNSDKMDKATLLGKVVEHIKELKSETIELSKVFKIPTELDQVIINLDSNTLDPCSKIFITALVCCEDRPELLSEIKQALDSLRLTMVQADMTCLGGRFICNFILCVTDNTGANEIATIKKSLKLLLGRIVSSSSYALSTNYRIKSKRQRFFCSSSYNTNDR
ncbi:transcription factor bHLH51-like [Rutidosis leptorrhynchoides]|uniref:transcription factor bHLH51-like n=1 Tax=Rutidosis leptorrhynchoides TaxID=125765 RepID=UPI003A9907CF